jgi:hypothetical protein
MVAVVFCFLKGAVVGKTEESIYGQPIHNRALPIAGSYGFDFYDSLTISTALAVDLIYHFQIKNPKRSI